MSMLENSIQQKITENKNGSYGLFSGRILKFNPEKRVVDIIVYRDGNEFIYGEVPWPSFGMGINLNYPKKDQIVVLGFIEGNKALPVVITSLENNSMYMSSRQDVSTYKLKGFTRVKKY